MTVRAATTGDRQAIQNVIMNAFADSEHEQVAQVALALLAESGAQSILSLVLEVDDVVVGYVAFSPVSLESDPSFCGYLLGPLAVLPAYQKRSVGSRLVKYGLQQLHDMGVHVAFVYGDPKYYARFDFSEHAAQPYEVPYPLQFPFGWQAVALNSYQPKATSASITCVEVFRDASLW